MSDKARRRPGLYRAELVRAIDMLNIRTILHPTDFSELSNHAFHLACGLAQSFRASLYVLHVATPVEAFKWELVFVEQSSQYLARDWAQLAQMRCAGIDIHRCLEDGDPAEQILRTAASIPCDFIVMGSHGRSGLTRLLLGSVAESVVRGASCHVIVAKSPTDIASHRDTVEPHPAHVIEPCRLPLSQP